MSNDREVCSLRTFSWRAAFFALLLAVTVVGADSVIFVPGERYREVLLRELASAKRSVSVALYLCSVDEETEPVLAALGELRRRGVAVEVTLDSGGRDDDAGDGVGRNEAAFARLKALDVSVAFDDGVLTHDKLTVIDGKTVLVGSSNWTKAAFTRNREANALIRSTEVARAAGDALRAIPRREAPGIEGVAVPESFLLDPSLFGRMAGGDERALDVWLAIRRVSTSGVVVVDMPSLAERLGIASMGEVAYRRQILKTLAKLEKSYGLIRRETSYGAAPRVTLSDGMEARAVRVPTAYWDQGWDRRLSLAGKCFYLMSLRESAASTLNPRWSTAEATLARRYGVSAWFVGRGVTELRRRGLLTVDYAPLLVDGRRARPSLYRGRDFYDPAALDRRFAELAEAQGAAAVARACSAAALVYADADFDGVKTLVRLEEEFGRTAVDRALAVLGAKRPDNPLRSMAYLIGTVRGMGGDAGGLKLNDGNP
jgi:hypothetical protein